MTALHHHGAPHPLCSGCGACCTGPREDVLVCVYSEREIQRFPPEHRRSLVELRYGLGWMTVPDPDIPGLFRCARLVGTIGVDAGCEIHEVKPTTCRVFPPGAPGCVDGRKAAGLPDAPGLPEHSLEQTEEFLYDYRMRVGDAPRTHYDPTLPGYFSWVVHRRRSPRKLRVLNNDDGEKLAAEEDREDHQQEPEQG